MNILVTPNSYKECADSLEIAKIISDKISVNKLFNIISKPLSDGGDGFLKICNSLFGLIFIPYNIFDSNNGVFKDYYVLLDRNNKSIYIESADLFGLKVVPSVMRTPLKLNSEILGDLLIKIADDVELEKMEIDNVWIGIGGTATIDFGMGALSKLGIMLFDKSEKIIEPRPQNFCSVNKISNNNKPLPFSVKCVVDVDTELIGNPGGIEFYGSQKGATADDLKIITSGVQNLIEIFSSNLKLDIPQRLNGAGGGLAAGLNIFLNAEIISGKDFIKKNILNDLNLNDIDVVITGEGSFDFQSLEGKGVGVIINLFKDKSIPIFLINGSTYLPENIKLPENIFVINTIDFFNSKTESIKNYRTGIEKAVEIVLNQIKY